MNFAMSRTRLPTPPSPPPTPRAVREFLVLAKVMLDADLVADDGDVDAAAATDDNVDENEDAGNEDSRRCIDDVDLLHKSQPLNIR